MEIDNCGEKGIRVTLKKEEVLLLLREEVTLFERVGNEGLFIAVTSSAEGEGKMTLERFKELSREAGVTNEAFMEYHWNGRP